MLVACGLALLAGASRAVAEAARCHILLSDARCSTCEWGTWVKSVAQWGGNANYQRVQSSGSSGGSSGGGGRQPCLGPACALTMRHLSATTWMPAFASCSSTAGALMPDCSHTVLGRQARMSSRWPGTSCGRLNTSTMSTVPART